MIEKLLDQRIQATFFGPFFWLFWSWQSSKAGRTFRNDEDPSRDPVEARAVTSARSTAKQKIRRVAPMATPSKQMWAGMALGSLLWGVMLYWLAVSLAFQSVVTQLADHAFPPSLKVARYSGSTASADGLAEMLLRDAKAEKSEELKARLKEVMISALGEKPLVDQEDSIAALRLAISLVYSGTPKCTNSKIDCAKQLRLATARLLIGSSEQCTKGDAIALINRSMKESEHCESTPLASRSMAWTPSQVADAMGCKAEECVLATYLLESGIDNEQTRWMATYGLGFIFGLGRLAVCALALFVAAALAYRQCALVELESQVHFLLTETKASQSAGKRLLTAEADALATRFDKEFNLPASPDATAQSAKDADPRVHPIAGIFAAAMKSSKSRDSTAVEDAEAASRESSERWSEMLTTVITLFPVIGLSATLLGLMASFSASDRIAIAVGADRAAAIRIMVGELSACFATTFLALLAMAFFTIVNMRQTHRARSLIGRSATRLDQTIGWRGHEPN